MVDLKQGDVMNTLTVGVTKRNESHVSDFRYAIQINIYLLKPLGAWPLANDETSRLKIIVHRASMIISTFLLLFIIVPWFLHIAKERLDFLLIVRTICPLSYMITILARYLLLIWHQDRLKFCIDHVADDWRYAITEDRNVMLANAKVSHTFSIMSVTFIFTCGALYQISPILAPKQINEDNVTIRPLSSPCELLVFDSQASPVYEIVFLLQVLSCCISYATNSGICSLIINLVMHVCGQCEILAMIIEETIDGGKHNNNSIEDRIATVIIRHLRLLRLVSNVSNMFTEICFVEFMNSSCVICLLCYYIVTDMNNNESFVQIFLYLFSLVSVLFNLYVICYMGDLLKESCQQVGTTCYAIEWYRMPSKRAIQLLLPIAMSQFPVMLTAGKMITMTLITFSDILKMSMAYFNLLREFTSYDVTRT